VGEARAASASAGRRVAGAAVLLAASILLSRVLGFGREAVIAALVGRGRTTDAYNAAFQIPDILFYLLAGGALSVAVIPLYQEAKQESQARAERFLATVLGTMTALTLLATVGLWLGAGALVALQFPHFEPEAQRLTTSLTRVVLPAQIFFLAGGIVRGALMAEDRFGSQAAAPLVYNLGIIAGGLAFGGSFGVAGFAWGALAGAVLGSLGTALFEARGRIRVGFRVAPFDPDFRRYAVSALPLMLGVTLITVDEWYARWFAGALAAGAIATLTFARRLMQLPVGLVGQASATAALPAFARLVAEGRHEELDRLVQRTLQGPLALAILLAAGTAALADPLVRAVYVRGAFAPGDAKPVADALQLLCLGVPGWVLQTLAVRPFYARADTWRPMLLGSLFVVAAFPLYAFLGRAHGTNGIALAGALAISANAIATVIVGRALHGAPRLWSLLGTLLRTLVCTLPSAALAWLVADIAMVRSGLVGFLGALYELAVGGAVYAALALPLALVLGDAPTRATLRSLLRRVIGRR
jgi:putative peptidoglycan lipid II flippase